MNYTFTNFIVGPSNRLAYSAAEAVAKAPGPVYNPLVVCGGVGLGKTHLLQAVHAYVRQHAPKRLALYVPAQRFLREVSQERLPSIDILLIDDLQFLVERERGREIFLRIFNTLYEAEKQIIVSMDRGALTPLDMRLRSRLASGLIADIQPPELETRLAIVHAKASESGISLSQGVAAMLVASLQNNVRDLENGLTRLIAYASLQARRIDKELVQAVLQNMRSESQYPVTVVRIEQVIAKRFSLTVRQLRSGKRWRSVVLARQVAMFLCREMTTIAPSDIGQHFGGRTASTVLHACGKIAHRQEIDEEMAFLLWELRYALQH